MEVRYNGYISRVKAIGSGSNQVVNFQLDEDVVNLGEVIIYAGENPAFEIIRNVDRNKKLNDKRKLEA